MQGTEGFSLFLLPYLNIFSLGLHLLSFIITFCLVELVIGGSVLELPIFGQKSKWFILLVLNLFCISFITGVIIICQRFLTRNILKLEGSVSIICANGLKLYLFL